MYIMHFPFPYKYASIARIEINFNVLTNDYLNLNFSWNIFIEAFKLIVRCLDALRLTRGCRRHKFQPVTSVTASSSAQYKT